MLIILLTLLILTLLSIIIIGKNINNDLKKMIIEIEKILKK